MNFVKKENLILNALIFLCLYYVFCAQTKEEAKWWFSTLDMDFTEASESFGSNSGAITSSKTVLKNCCTCFFSRLSSSSVSKPWSLPIFRNSLHYLDEGDQYRWDQSLFHTLTLFPVRAVKNEQNCMKQSTINLTVVMVYEPFVGYPVGYPAIPWSLKSEIFMILRTLQDGKIPTPFLKFAVKIYHDTSSNLKSICVMENNFFFNIGDVASDDLIDNHSFGHHTVYPVQISTTP